MKHEMSSHPGIERMRATIEGVHAPASLRERIAADAQRTAPRRMIYRRMRLTGALAGAAAAAGAALAIVLPAGAPTVLQAAALASRGPAAAAPATDSHNPGKLLRSVDGVTFPTWSDRYPWHASGQRVDSVGGRHAVTVFYASTSGDAQVGYTIVAGKALSWPSGARTVTRHGVEVHFLRHGGRTIATWREHGHQCVISAPPSVPVGRVVELAASDGASEAAASSASYA
jgi:hypothetical protein